MIYLQNTSNKPQTVVVPTANPLAGTAVFVLFSTVDRREAFRTEVSIQGAKRLSATFAVTLPGGLSNGEYQYGIQVKNKFVEGGVAVIGDYTREVQFHENIEYKQYGE